MYRNHKQCAVSFCFFISVDEKQAENINIYYKSKLNADTKCNNYGKDGNTGPDYDCNQIGREVVVRRWDTAILALCNIKVYGGKSSSNIKDEYLLVS